MDWGLFSFRSGTLVFRQKLLWSTSFYVIAGIINLILRFSWAANRIPQFSKMDASLMLLAVELAEVFRRSMWNLLRIEWEVVNSQIKGSISDN